MAIQRRGIVHRLLWHKLAPIRLGVMGYELQYDVDYGVDDRFGWSLAYNGSFAVELKPSLLWCLWNGWWDIRDWIKYDRECELEDGKE